MSASLPALHLEGLKYVVGESGAEFAASDNGPQGFGGNVVSFDGKVFAVNRMSLRADDLSGGYDLRGSFVVPRSVRQIFPEMGLGSDETPAYLCPCPNLLAVAFESQCCLCSLEA
jgi:hypothetical protein